jgi:hypothetical protein
MEHDRRPARSDDEPLAAPFGADEAPTMQLST